MISKRILIIGVIFSSVLLSGCRAAANNAGKLLDGDDIGRPLDSLERAHNKINQNTENEESKEFENENLDDEARAERLKTLAEGVNGVNGATVVVNGDSAVIGLSLRGEPEDDAVISIKKRVEKEAMDADPRLTRAAISCAPEQYHKITGDEEPRDKSTEIKSEDELNHVVPGF